MNAKLLVVCMSLAVSYGCARDDYTSLAESDERAAPALESSEEQGPVSISIELLDAEGKAASMFPADVTIPARVTIRNDGPPASCHTFDGGPRTSIHLSSGEREIASSTRGLMFTQALVPFELATGMQVGTVVIQGLFREELEPIESLPPGTYSTTLRARFRCDVDGQSITPREVAYPFRVTAE